jgi:nitrate/nitrite transporter NarK
MLLFAYWGVTSILLFWAAMIRTTREWGGHLAQGKAFGILDGGRGLVAAAVATLGVFLFSYILPDDIAAITGQQRQQAMQGVIYYYTLVTMAAGFLVWFMIPEYRHVKMTMNDSFAGMRAVITQKIVWMQAIVVICAYCGYKGLDNYALYMVEVLGMNEVDSARMTSLSAYLRPVAAITAGILVDRSSASRIISIAFAIMILSYFILSISTPTQQLLNIIYANLVLTFIAVFAVRGVYFALIEESAIPSALTGTAVGLISVIGFTPDVFFAAIAGRILDASPGLVGHQHYFLLLTGIAVTGMVTTLVLAYTARFKTSENVK